MVDPSSIGDAVSSYGQSMLPTIMKWVGIALISALFIGGLYFLWLFIQYNTLVYRLQIGEGKAGQYYIKGIKTTRAKRTRRSGSEFFEYLFRRGATNPVEERYVFPINGILLKSATFVYDLGSNLFIPSNVSFAINSPAVINFNILPFEVRQAASLELQKVAKEYQEESFMAKYGSQMFSMFAILFACILVGAVIWMTYQYIGGQLSGATQAANNLAEAFKDGVAQKFTPGG